MTDFPQRDPLDTAGLSFKSWLAAFAATFVALLIAALPYAHW